MQIWQKGETVGMLRTILRAFGVRSKKKAGRIRLWAMAGSALMGTGAVVGAAGFFSGDPANAVAHSSAGGLLMGAGAVSFGAGAAMETIGL